MKVVVGLAKKKVLVTGASSFIGIRLCELLAAQGCCIYALVRESSAGLNAILNLHGVCCVLGDVESIESVLKKIGTIDIVFHLAWSGVGGVDRADPEIQIRNFENSMNVLRHAKAHGCSLFVFGGSQAEYGRCNGLITELTLCNPESEYGKAKLAFTMAGTDFCEQSNISYRMARIFSVYGPGDHEWTLVSELIRSMSNNEVVPLTQCEQRWNFLYLDDAVNALISLASDFCGNGIYNIASANTRPLKEYVNIIRQKFPESPAPGFGLSVGVATHEINPVVDKILRKTNWKERFSFEDGIRNTISSYRYL
ncbi:NAD(P)-dependent oxidoreductase [Uliginosibacterium sp. 31-12]|uniref:NAD-dependent epimerase/dehydratase family protein n=1 Tax=Uliginosibacterium sp. 31-12 TaxID=3062781 RepID=UPI0026E190FD|nr:NAD(P)-dependent oxidoreductase [Uliginosibacterium sp. 31-12]MDO6384985.1 NAD(P)-dependent oxidoreductase [Uliginosibacterium sp. 31-12]